jgi:MSHA biogenesis protein MshQ
LGLSTQLWAAPGDTLFTDDFERNNLGPDWTSSDSTAGAISNFTSNSGRRSLHTCCTAVTVTSRVFDLSGVGGADLSLWLRIGSDVFSEDPDIGGNEDFFIEYLDNTGAWVTLQRYPGGVTPGQVFTPTFSLPANALHAGFRFRVRQNGGSGFGRNGNRNGSRGWDYYHVDDVRLVETSGITVGGAFCDDFENGLANWSVFAAGGDAGIGPQTFQSAGNSLYTRWGAVEVRSRSVDLSGASGAEVSIWVRRGSDTFSEYPDPGEDLILQYMDNAGNWQTLEVFSGGGVAGQAYKRTYTLPANALHAAWQFRIRQTGGSGPDWDYWHVDDFCVTPTTPPSPLAAYQFEQANFSTAGTPVVDDSGNGWTASTLGGAATDPNGKVCKALAVPANNATNIRDGLDTGIDVDADIGNSGTVAFWFRPNWKWNKKAGRRTLFDAGERYLNSTNDKYFYLESNGRDLIFALEDSLDRDFNLSTRTFDKTPAGTWVHVAVTWDLPGNRLEIYANGNLVASTTIASNGRIGNLGTLVFGDAKTNYIVSGNSADGTFDEIQIYQGVLSQSAIQAAMNATHPCTVPIDHFKFSHDNFGLFCLAETITLSARDASDNVLATFDQTVILDTGSGRGTWSLVSGGGSFSDPVPDDGLATYTFSATDAGVAQFALSYQEGSVPLNLVAALQSNPTITDDDSEGLLDWAPSGFVITQNPLSNPPPNPINDPIQTQTAGANYRLYITAFGQTATHPQCGVIETYTGARPLNFWFDYQNPATGTRAITIDGSAIATSEAASATQNVVFTAGQAQVVAKYKDVGQVQLHVEDKTSYAAQGLVIAGATNPYVHRPADLLVSVPGNPAAADASGAVFRKAGEAFTVVVTAVDAEGDPTPNFGLESVPEGIRLRSSQLVAPLGGRNGSVAGQMGNDTSFTLSGPGQLTSTTVFFDEVGIIRLRADIADADYLGTGPLAGSESANVGRFVPDRFAVVSNSPQLRNATAPWACSFTYQGQPIDFASGLEPVLTVQAVNKAGQPTLNYGGAFWKLNSLLPNRSYVNQSPGIAAVLTSDLTAGSVTLSGTADFTDGAGTYQVTGDRLNWNKAAATPVAADAPFNAVARLQVPVIDLTDGDGVCFDADANGTCDLFTSNDISGGEIRYGRWFLENAQGSELSDLSLVAQAQYYNGTGFVTNTDDSCSATFSGWVPPSLGPYGGNLQAGETLLTQQPMLPGILPMTLSAPGEGNDGSVVVTLTTPPWLYYDFDGDGLADAPSALAVFGIYAGRDPVIYWRQRFGN